MKLFLGGGGTYVAHIRWMASISTFTLSVEGGDHQPVQFDQALFDLWNILTGWAMFEEGQAPKWVMDPDLSTPADRRTVPITGRPTARRITVHVIAAVRFVRVKPRRFRRRERVLFMPGFSGSMIRRGYKGDTSQYAT